MAHRSIITQIHKAVDTAREMDQFSHRGQLAVAVKQGKAQVQRVTFDATGKSTITRKSEFVPLILVMLNLNTEAQFGTL